MKTDQIETKGKQIKRLKIRVTQKEIDEAHKGNSQKCMIHEAIKRDYPHLRKVYVDKNQVRFTDPKTNTIYTWDLSAPAKVALLKWDDGEEVKPFDTWIQKPIVREKKLRKDGTHHVGGHQSTAERHRGAIPRALTIEARRQRGSRDRVFGQKLWSDELRKIRENLIPQDTEALIRDAVEKALAEDRAARNS